MSELDRLCCLLFGLAERCEKLCDFGWILWHCVPLVSKYSVLMEAGCVLMEVDCIVGICQMTNGWLNEWFGRRLNSKKINFVTRGCYTQEISHTNT